MNNNYKQLKRLLKLSCEASGERLSYESQDLINETKEDILEYGENHNALALFKNGFIKDYDVEISEEELQELKSGGNYVSIFDNNDLKDIYKLNLKQLLGLLEYQNAIISDEQKIKVVLNTEEFDNLNEKAKKYDDISNSASKSGKASAKKRLSKLSDEEKSKKMSDLASARWGHKFDVRFSLVPAKNWKDAIEIIVVLDSDAKEPLDEIYNLVLKKFYENLQDKIDLNTVGKLFINHKNRNVEVGTEILETNMIIRLSNDEILQALEGN